MPVGKIKFYKVESCYGFIEQEGGLPDVFFHFSVVAPDANGYKSAQRGQWVEFDAEQTERGLSATSVTILPIPAGAL
jgi:cold shock CspA family protein